MNTPLDGTKAQALADDFSKRSSGDLVLGISSLSKAYGESLAVDDLSFQVFRGETLCLLGPNGAGKTTTIEICEGFTKPSSGKVSVLGLDPSTKPDAVREKIGIMLQGGGSYSGIRVREMLDLTASYRKNTLDAQWLLSVLGLQSVSNSTYRRLSGGQKQRLSLALAIIGKPELVFLDEPTAGLDAQSRLLVWELVSALKNDGVSVVLTTHFMDEAEALADRVIIMEHGKKVAEGSPAQLTRSLPGGTVTFETNCEVDLELLRAAGLTVSAQRPLNYSLEVNGGKASPQTVALLAQELAKQDVLARRINTSSATLEDVFLRLTGRKLRN